ncbi:MAG: hypothetical protein LAP21_18850, partial [Acidobacteriia bacterium]|nr:hypothetical protein [Terriglobia bacterium]
MALMCVNPDCKYNDTHGPIMDSDQQYCPDCGSTLKRLRNSVLMQVQPAGRWRRFFGILIDNMV